MADNDWHSEESARLDLTMAAQLESIREAQDSAQIKLAKQIGDSDG